MTTDTRPREDALDADPSGSRRARVQVTSRAVAMIAGIVAVVGALLLPFAPVSVSTPEVRWPVDPGAPTPTALMLTAYRPVDLEVRFSCRTARAAADTPDGVVLSTMGPTVPDAGTEALVVRARPEGLSVRSAGQDVFAGPLPAGDCGVVVAGDAAAMRVVVDGTVVSTVASRPPEPLDPREATPAERAVLPDSGPVAAPVTPLPEVDVLRTSVPPGVAASRDDLSVRMTVDDAFDHTPAPSKSVLIAVVVLALVVGAAAMSVLVVAARRPGDGPGTPAGTLRRRWHRIAARVRARPWTVLPPLLDVAVPAVLVAWTFLAPITDDDGYYSAMAANVPFSGYVANYYQLGIQGFTPFSWPYYALSWWQTTFGVGPVVLRVPALALGIGTWFLARAFVARTPLLGAGRSPGRWAPPVVRLVLAAAFLAWWLPYDMGVRPEPVIAFFTIATLVAVAEGIERRRLALLGLAVGLGSVGLMAAPTGFITLGPLVAAAPTAWRLIRELSARWYVAVGRWVVVLAPGAVGSLLAFSDGAYRDFVRSQEIFAPVQKAQTWYEELVRYQVLLDDGSHYGSYARRAAVIVCLFALVWFVVLTVAARLRDVPVPGRLLLAGWSTLLAFVLLLPTPSKPTHHFGAFAGLGAAFLALMLVVGPRLVADLDRQRRVPQPALVGAAVATILLLALAGHGRDMWPYGWGLGMPAYGDYPSVRGVEFDQPLWWALGLVVVAAVLALVAHRRAPRLRRLALAGAVPVMITVLLLGFTVWTVGDFVRAADRTADTWSPQVDAWRDPTGAGCGLAGQMDVLDPRGGRALPVAVAPGEPLPPPPLALDAPEAPPAESRPEPFVPGAFLPTSPPPADLPPDVPVWGSFLVPEDGATADARTGAFTTSWFRLPPSSEGVAVAVSGRTGSDVTLRAEYGRQTPEGFAVIEDREIGEAANSVAWRTIPLTAQDAPPPGADVVRLTADDASTATGGWLAFSAPVARPWVPLPQYLPPGGAVGVAWQVRTLFPCQRQPRQQDGITEPAVAAIGIGPTPDAARADWTFDPTRSGLLGHTDREAERTLLVTRVRDVEEEVDDLHVWEYRQPYPADGYRLVPGRETVSGLP